ncbi:RraA family protein [Amycolatopsis pithecellobii]|uniref:Putative 4-hydroxy-4-methyl-2-oxoglutarate aldolase n=1 Tax=Amycolatopsis pithecellobii TaxID=664692 RepID=A0A6N7YYV0_9PSEU|nr:RraA family protein [Amycolatopsis pithecellobii]MTD57052.1 RraA family protein [Amycolatopsis pithecellobii]
MSDLAAPAEYLALGASALSDAMDRLGINGSCFGIAPLSPAFTLAGFARTVRYVPCGVVKGTVGDFIDDYDETTVAVLDNSGRLDCTVWGDILTDYAVRNRLAGTVIDGVCRDTALCREQNYPVFSRGAYMRTGKDRVQAQEIDGPVSIGGVRVEPGDLVVGDADGVVVVPAARATEVFDVATEIVAREDEIRSAVRAGSKLMAARIKFGYHHLQTRADS